MLWKVDYVIDSGYDWYNNTCILNVDTIEDVFAVLKQMSIDLDGDSHILFKENLLKIEKIFIDKDEKVLYNSYRK